MSKLIQVSLTVLMSVAVTALVMAVVVPTHARSGATDHAAPSDIRHAVLTEHLGASSGELPSTSACPALPKPDASTSCPSLEGVAPRHDRVPFGFPEATAVAVSGCPYLAALAARTGCPALSTRTESSTCPYSPSDIRPDTSPGLDNGDWRDGPGPSIATTSAGSSRSTASNAGTGSDSRSTQPPQPRV